MNAGHEEIIEDLEAYSLGILEPERAAVVEEHLRTCETCQAELRGLETAVFALAMSAPEVAPRAGARDRFAAMLATEIGGAGRDLAPAPVPVAPPNGSQPPAPARPAVVEQPRRRLWDWFSPAWAVAAALAVLLLAVGGWALSLNAALQAEQNANAAAQQQIAQLQQERDLAIELLGNPNVVPYTLASTSGAPEPAARLWVDEQAGRALLVTNNLDPAPAGKVYELWLISDAPVAVNVFNTPPSGNGLLQFQLPGPLQNYKVVAVTVEEKLEPAPTTQPILAGEI